MSRARVRPHPPAQVLRDIETLRACEVTRLRAPRDSKGYEPADSRFAVVVQPDPLALSPWLDAPTPASARGASFRPDVRVKATTKRVLAAANHRP